MGDVDSHLAPRPTEPEALQGLPPGWTSPPGASNTSEVWDPCSLSSSSFGSLALGTILLRWDFYKAKQAVGVGWMSERTMSDKPGVSPVSTQVSLDSRVRETINRSMAEALPDIFDDAQLQIYTLMHRDSYPFHELRSLQRPAPLLIRKQWKPRISKIFIINKINPRTRGLRLGQGL